MITRDDVPRVIDAFILEETLYWWLHPIEQVNTVRGIDAWVSLDVGPTNGARRRLGVPQSVHGHPG